MSLLDSVLESPLDQLLLAGGSALILGLSGWIFFTMRHHDSALLNAWRRYLDAIERHLNRLAKKESPLEIVMLQILGIVGLLAGWIFLGMDLLAIAAILVVPGTFAGFLLAHEKRKKTITLQLDSWLLMMSNMLHATGSVGAALRRTADLAQPPLLDELEILIKKVDIGTSFEDGLRQMYERVPTPSLKVVVKSLEVGKRLGGDLPALIEENASSLREAQRIDAFITSQVAQGKTQVIVLALAPFPLIYMFLRIDPNFFKPLLDHILAAYIIAAAGALWAGAIWAGIKIMRVDV